MADAVGDLARLELEERAVSLRRRRLQERIDFIRGGGEQDEDGLERLAKLLAEEREVSERRRELHNRIDALRNQAGMGAVPGSHVKERLLETRNTAYVAAIQADLGPATHPKDDSVDVGSAS